VAVALPMTGGSAETTGRTGGTGAARSAAKRLLPWLLLAPVLVYLAIFYIAPLGVVVVASVTDPTLSLAHYRDFFTDGFYLQVLGRTFLTSLIVTLGCLLLGYPLAYAMARRNDSLVLAMLTLVALSFWTSFLVRTYAWMVILGNRGPVTAFFRMIGWDPPPEILFTRFSSTPSSFVTCATARSSATCTSASAGTGTHSGRSSSRTWSSRT